MNESEIYFHVGLGRVASTYLQNKVFNNLEGIHYIHKNRYRRSVSIIQNKGLGKYLVSCELDRQFDEELPKFLASFPDAKVIILFRDHGSWIASQYRRFVKNGWYYSFEDFITLDKDREGFWYKKHLNYYSKLESIEKLSKHKPLILFYDELKKDPWGFFDKIASYTGTTYNKESISLDKVHSSYSEKQLLVLRSFCRRYIRHFPRQSANRTLNWFVFRPWWAFFHLVMYVAYFFPKAWVPKEAFTDSDYLKKINNLYSDDWEKVKSYAHQNDPLK
jgi:hypothetical protein